MIWQQSLFLQSAYVCCQTTLFKEERALFACSVHNSCGDSMIGRYASDDTDFFDFQSKSRASGKKSAFHLEHQPPTNSHKADFFPSPMFQVARFRIDGGWTFVGSSCKKRTASFRRGPSCHVKLIIISLCRRLCRCLRGSNPVQRTCRPRRCPERRCGLR